MQFNSTREQVAFLARRATWGLAPGELDVLESLGVAATIDRLVDPSSAGLAEEASAWADWNFVYDRSDRKARRQQDMEAFERWMGRLLSTERPLDHQLAWFWHDHFAVSMQVVRHLPAMLAHLDLCWSLGRGDVRALIRQVTTDAAMLVFLDGATSKGTAPNENFGRELLELYTVGVGNFTEADVKAAAAALTGWVVRRRDGWKVRFVPARHDDTPQTLLGVDGVHDADTTIAAATSSPACPVFLASKLGRYLLGDIDDAAVLAFGNVLQRGSRHLPRSLRRHSALVSVGLRRQPFLRRCRGCSRRSRPPVPACRPPSWPSRIGAWASCPAVPPTSGAIPVRRPGWRHRPLRLASRRQSTLPERHPTRLLRLRRPGRVTGPGWPTCSCVRLASRTPP